ncbi:MAG: hypothetical protein Q7R47_04595 [Candidatus Diapherotrites archaeon]|nr:hypothetical protein [Candidatus Diapherotrites archaeon]
MKKLFVTRPNNDDGTAYLSVWSNEIIQQAKDKGWTVLQSDGAKATRLEVQSKLEKTPPDLVCFNGHGNEREIYGQGAEVLMDSSSAGLLDHTVTFARSCESLVVLGKKAVEKGCRAFVGYSHQFWFPKVKQYELTPLEDPAAKPVLEVSNTIPIKLIKNATVSEAIEASKTLSRKYILKMIVSKEPYDRAALRALVQNDSCVGFVGDPDAKIE